MMGAQRDTLNNNEQVHISQQYITTSTFNANLCANSSGSCRWSYPVPKRVCGAYWCKPNCFSKTQIKCLPLWLPLTVRREPMECNWHCLNAYISTESSTIVAPTTSSSIAKELLDKCHIGSGINPGYKAYENRSSVDASLFNFWAGEIQSTVSNTLYCNTSCSPIAQSSQERGFELSAKNDSLGVHSPVSRLVVQKTVMDAPDVYTFDTYGRRSNPLIIQMIMSCFCRICLPAGCYEAELKWNRTVINNRSPFLPDDPTMFPSVPTYSEAMGLLAFIPQCEAFFSPLLQKQEICLDEVTQTTCPWYWTHLNDC
jgi:hypothetical protein